MSGLGSMLLRRVGSQRGGLAPAAEPQALSAASEHDTSSTSTHHEPQQQPRGGLGGLLRRATSLRGGLDSSSNHSRGQQQRKSLDQQQQQYNKDASSMDAVGSTSTSNKEDTTTACTSAATTAAAPVSPPPSETTSGGGLRNMFGRLSSLRTMGSSNRKLEVQKQQKAAEEALQPVLIMTDENHGKIVFQELEPEEEKEATALLQLDDLSTFDDDKSNKKRHSDRRRRLSSNNSYNISNMLHASMPDLSSTTSSGCSSLSSSGRGSLDSPPSHRKSFQPFATNATGVCPSPPSMAGHCSFSGTPSSSWTKNNVGARDNADEFCLHMSTSELDFSNGEAAVSSSQEKDKIGDANGSHRGLGGRLRTFFQRTRSGRDLPTEQDATSIASAPLLDNNQSFDNVFGNMSCSELEEMEKLNHKDIMSHLNSILEQRQHEDNEEDSEECKQEEETNQVMGGLMNIVEEYEAYEGFESANRFYSSDEDEKYSYNENASSDDGLVDEIDSFMFENDEESPVDGMETDEDDDDVFYDMPASASPSSEFDIEATHNAAYSEEREYDDLELFYEEQTFAGVGGSMLLGQAAELMTVHEYDEEEYDSDADSGSI